MSEATTHTANGRGPGRGGMSILDNGIHSTSDPRMLLSDAALSEIEKRNILASWASDRRAVVNNPSLRQLDDGTIVNLDDILNALKALDRAPVTVTSHRRSPTHRTF